MRGRLLGAFRLESELGSGGMGTVWLASVVEESPGLKSGQPVAVKIVHPHLLRHPQYATRFLREAEVGHAVRHPNVVHTFEAGTRDLDGEETSYLVMEYVAGRTLRDLFDDLGTVPEALLREIATQVCHGLGAIHDLGIVHRDLKPENVLITEDQQVRIMDLGVARLVDESVALTREGQFAGSLHYAAPEQFRGTAPTARSDLYSLGVLLHELASGANPFAGNDAARVIAAHLDEVPLPAPDLTPFFAAVIATLLAKQPEDRFASATELGRILKEGEDSDWWKKTGRAGPGRPRPRVPVSRETSVYGRDTEIETLRSALETARAGAGGFLLIEGEAGIGKSRLVDQFLSTIGPAPVTVLYGSYSPSGGVGGLSQAILDHCGTEGVARFVDVAPELAMAFERLVRHESPDPDEDPIPSGALHALFCHLLRGLAREQPLVWIVEDLHFADPDSRGICLSLARAATTEPVLLVATSRPGLPEAELATYRLLPHYRRLSLDRLSPREIMLLLREAFRSSSLADQLGGRIAWKTDGVPFFVLEMIRTLREGDFIRQLPNGSFVATKVVSEMEVPSAVRDLIEARLRELSRRDREILDSGAVAGFEFDPVLIASVLERRRIRVLQDLASLERRTALIRGVGRHYRFDHHQIQEVLYQDLPEALRAEYHTALAHAARSERPDSGNRPGEEVVFLVHHQLRGSQPEEAGPYVRRAIAHLELSSRNEAALDLATRAESIEAHIADGDRFELNLARARLLELLGRLDEVPPALSAAESLADRTGDPTAEAKVKRAQGVYLVGMNRLDEASECFERAVEEAERAGDDRLRALALGNLGSIRAMRSDWEPAIALIGEACDLARAHGDLRRVASHLGNLGYIHLLGGRFAAASECYDEALALTESSGDRHGQAVMLLRLGGLSMDLGRFEEAMGRFRAAHEGFRAVGDRVNEAAAVGSLGNVWIAQGRPQPAIEQYERCLHLAREIGDLLGEGNALNNLGYPYLNLGDTDRGEEVFTMSIEVADRLGDPLLRLHAREGLATVARYRGDFERAERIYRECIATSRELSYGFGTQTLVQSYGEFLLDQGREEEAREHFLESLDLASETKQPAQIMLARAGLAAMGADDPAEVFLLYEATSERLAPRTRMLARLLLSRATGDRNHLRAARSIFEALREQAPEAYRDSIIENVPLHREVLEREKPRGTDG